MNIESMRNYYIVRHSKCYAFTLLNYVTNQLVKKWSGVDGTQLLLFKM